MKCLPCPMLPPSVEASCECTLAMSSHKLRSGCAAVGESVGSTISGVSVRFHEADGCGPFGYANWVASVGADVW
eukprot:6657558-Pyramimonas_sp.AAC.1